MLAPGAYARTGEADPIRYYRWPIIGGLYRRRVARCISLLPAGDRVLEVGYGSGVGFLNLASKFRRIVGVDVHERADSVARTFQPYDLDLDLRQASVTELPFDDGSFAAAVAISIHEELPPEQQERAFEEIHRVLRPGGCYVVGIPGVNVLMNSAFYLLGCNIKKYHVSDNAWVMSAMRRRFHIEEVLYSPRWMPPALTAYVCIKGRRT